MMSEPLPSSLRVEQVRGFGLELYLEAQFDFVTHISGIVSAERTKHQMRPTSNEFNVHPAPGGRPHLQSH